MIKPYYSTALGGLYQGRCQHILKQLPDDSIDSLITDPPYGLSFMGKKWDYDVPSVEIWQECLRVLKPGGTALIFAGSRTQHRMACNVEDAGFILKDCIMWIYGSGFPKATDISKQFDRGHTREVVGYHNYTNQDIRGNAYDSERAKERPRLKAEITAPRTAEAQLWNGWKSHGLKPAYEPILVCMKPNEGSYAQNALKWGVSGLNIDRSRISIDPKTDKPQLRTMNRSQKTEQNGWGMNQKTGDTPQVISPQGRYPANIILDGSDEVLGLFPQSSITGNRKNKNRLQQEAVSTPFTRGQNAPEYTDSGSVARFFYCAKASKSERNAGCENIEAKTKSSLNKMMGESGQMKTGSGNERTTKFKNNHPTVKSLALMKYLCTLTQTPTRGTVLDPFAGSGSTLVACEQLGRSWIGIEKEEEYCQIAKARIAMEASQLKLFK